MKLLLHACCGPCAAGVMLCLAEEAVHPVLYWNNPNIHPFMEYKSRLDSLRTYAETSGVPLVVDGEYGLREFMKATAAQPDSRCSFCYRARLSAAAQYAARNGFDAFSTTLFVSPYQNHDLIALIGEEEGRKHGARFLKKDFRRHFRDGQETARDMGLYMQKYCGCAFSEEERYEKKRAKLQEKKGFFPNFPPPQA